MSKIILEAHTEDNKYILLISLTDAKFKLSCFSKTSYSLSHYLLTLHTCGSAHVSGAEYALPMLNYAYENNVLSNNNNFKIQNF
jgi:hypothetical protein